MNTIAPSLVAASAAIMRLLGLLHLLYTFYSPQLLPRDEALHTRMQEVSPVITCQTTMWKAWVGFNASHSYGLILFGTVYGSLALAHSDVLFQSVFLLSLGLLWLFGTSSSPSDIFSACRSGASSWQRSSMASRLSSDGPHKSCSRPPRGSF
jgi:hypothetical protein